MRDNYSSSVILAVLSYSSWLDIFKIPIQTIPSPSNLNQQLAILNDSYLFQLIIFLIAVVIFLIRRIASNQKRSQKDHDFIIHLLIWELVFFLYIIHLNYTKIVRVYSISKENKEKLGTSVLSE